MISVMGNGPPQVQPVTSSGPSPRRCHKDDQDAAGREAATVQQRLVVTIDQLDRWYRGWQRCVCSARTPCGSSSNAMPSALGTWCKIKERVLQEPANGSITANRVPGRCPASIPATSRPIRSPSASRVHSTAVRAPTGECLGRTIPPAACRRCGRSRHRRSCRGRTVGPRRGQHLVALRSMQQQCAIVDGVPFARRGHGLHSRTSPPTAAPRPPRLQALRGCCEHVPCRSAAMASGSSRLSGVLDRRAGRARVADAAVDDEVRHVDALRLQLARQRLRQAAQRELAHGERRRLRIALHAGRGAGEEDRALTPRHHAPRRLLRRPRNPPKRRHRRSTIATSLGSRSRKAAARAVAGIVAAQHRCGRTRGPPRRTVPRRCRLFVASAAIGQRAGLLARAASLSAVRAASATR